MSLGIFLKSLRASVLQRIILRQLKAFSCENVVVLTYHRILPKVEVTAQIEQGMYVTPTTLKKHLLFLQKYFKFVSVDKVENLFLEKVSDKEKKPLCLISFDDGWLDFYQYAWPILKQENVPATVYLPTKLIGSSDMFWTDKLAFILINNGLKVVVDILDDAEIRNALNKCRTPQTELDVLIKGLKKFKYSQIESLLGECVEKLGLTEPSERSFMNWNEIREIHSEGLVSFGSHTVNHAILTTLSKAEIYDELLLSKQKMIDEGVVGDNISFCYPNGNYTKDIADMVEEIGYSSAMSCDAGWNSLESDPFSLKRISLHQDISSTDYLLAYRLAQYL